MDLHEATEAGDLDTVRELVDGGADVNAKDDMQYTCLQGAVGGGHAHVTKYLLSKGADPNTVSWDGQTPLMWAATYGGDNSRVVFMLIKKGARVNERDYSQRTALHHAAFNGDPHTARALIINGADQTLRDKYAKTPRELAEENHNPWW